MNSLLTSITNPVALDFRQRTGLEIANTPPHVHFIRVMHKAVHLRKIHRIAATHHVIMTKRPTVDKKVATALVQQRITSLTPNGFEKP